MLIDSKDALTAVDDCNYKIMSGYEWIRKQEIKKRLKELPSAESENRLAKITDLVEGTIDHFDLDDAMDLLYQIKEVLK